MERSRLSKLGKRGVEFDWEKGLNGLGAGGVSSW